MDSLRSKVRAPKKLTAYDADWVMTLHNEAVEAYCLVFGRKTRSVTGSETGFGGGVNGEQL